MNNNWIKQLSRTYINLTEEDKKQDPRGVNPGMRDTSGPSTPGSSRGESSSFNFADRNPDYGNNRASASTGNPGSPPKPPKFKPGRGNKFSKPEWDSQNGRWIIKELDRKGNVVKEYYYDPKTGQWYGE